MSNNKSQPNSPQEPVPTATTPETQETISLTPSQIADIVADQVDKALAARDEQVRLKNEADEREYVAQKARYEEEENERIAVAQAAQLEASTGPLYGNQDTKQEFDLRKMTTWNELPNDKVVIILPQYNTNGRGERTSVDAKSSIVQPIDPGDHKNRSTTDKNTGSTTYQALAIEPIVVHIP